MVLSLPLQTAACRQAMARIVGQLFTGNLSMVVVADALQLIVETDKLLAEAN